MADAPVLSFRNKRGAGPQRGPRRSPKRSGAWSLRDLTWPGRPDIQGLDKTKSRRELAMAWCPQFLSVRKAWLVLTCR